MGAKNNVISFKADDELTERIDTYRDEYNFEDTSKAARQLSEVGLREQQSPLLFRLKGEVTYWVGQLGIAAVIVVLGGFTTPVLAPASSALFAIALVVAAVALLAGFEILRFATGMNELGVEWRDLLNGDRT